MDPFDLDEEYRDHVNRIDWLNPTAEDVAATRADDPAPHEPPCAWCGESFTLGDAWHLRRGCWFHTGCVQAWEEMDGGLQTGHPQSDPALRIVREWAASPTLRRVIERLQCE